jgi:hypothetical protein
VKRTPCSGRALELASGKQRTEVQFPALTLILNHLFNSRIARAIQGNPVSKKPKTKNQKKKKKKKEKKK